MALTAVVHGLLEQQDIRCAGGCFGIQARFACTLFSAATDLNLGENHFPYVLATRELVHREVHATVLHGDGAEFGAYGPRFRRNVCNYCILYCIATQPT